MGRCTSYIPEDLRTVNSFLHPVGADMLIDFLKQAFEAEEVEVHREQVGGPTRHAIIRLASARPSSKMSEAHGQYGPIPTGLHLYVPDVDAAHERALKADATSISAPANQPYGERGEGVKDPQGTPGTHALYLCKGDFHDGGQYCIGFGGASVDRRLGQDY